MKLNPLFQNSPNITQDYIKRKLSSNDPVSSCNQTSVGNDCFSRSINYPYFGKKQNVEKLNSPEIIQLEDPELIKELHNAIDEIEKSIINTDFNTPRFKFGLPLDNNGKITIPEHKKLENNLNTIIEIIPEFKDSIGNKQNPVHKYTRDIHILSVLQEVVKNENYEKLPINDKKIAKLFALMHDIEKEKEKVDQNHPLKSALKANTILQRLAFSTEDRIRIVNLVRNHHWLAELNCAEYPDIDSKAFAFSRIGDFEVVKIFSEADLRSITDGFYDYKFETSRYSNKDALRVFSEEIQKRINP
ncbi:MAG: hypothetical protein PHC34_03715 [Candidatus Gastranaerophilales bacterium]|nr:hypothetical protein [Candidatus Gastranaerophilales bacterium]